MTGVFPLVNNTLHGHFWVSIFCRNNHVGLEIVEKIQKLLNSRNTQKAWSTGNVHEYLHVGEEHLKRRDFKKAVISLSLVRMLVFLPHSQFAP